MYTYVVHTTYKILYVEVPQVQHIIAPILKFDNSYLFFTLH